ncbi:hypothetical protein Pmani_034729 [Petrolisthes manimaculis]|uniref:Uncharacterized protein n=1 Tax=Petrolisthes manimaculis TaxID=1843537 RepID=A0AAE1NN45_9EUCA|nr:hypothetical protein Pmani_034729 [Petrolisthes manimaculis]
MVPDGRGGGAGGWVDHSEGRGETGTDERDEFGTIVVGGKAAGGFGSSKVQWGEQEECHMRTQVQKALIDRDGWNESRKGLIGGKEASKQG